METKDANDRRWPPILAPRRLISQPPRCASLLSPRMAAHTYTASQPPLHFNDTPATPSRRSAGIQSSCGAIEEEGDLSFLRPLKLHWLGQSPVTSGAPAPDPARPSRTPISTLQPSTLQPSTLQPSTMQPSNCVAPIDSGRPPLSNGMGPVRKFAKLSELWPFEVRSSHRSRMNQAWERSAP